jgi:deazaflavin-dependent oxidoreductase (nitroreductase family)
VASPPPPEVVAEFARAGDGPITVDITTTGRRSGEPQRIEIWIVKVGDRVVIGGTPGPRDWLANLRVDPGLIVHLKEGVVADVAATAHEVTDPDVRSEIWNHSSTTWYRGQDTVARLIESAPTVELTVSLRPL